jgi:hypothetical protein
VNKELQQQLAESEEAAKNLNESVIPAFNALLKQKGLSMGIQP